MRKLLVLLWILIATTASSYAQSQPVPEYPLINGIRQAITIEGDTAKPLLLFLHGGPGRSLMPFAATIAQQLPTHFTVVHWDQRGTGLTQEQNASPQPITPDLITQDTRDLIRYLLRRFHQSKLYLVSHSWGSVPGFQIAFQHPEWLYAYVAISPVIDPHQSARLALQDLKGWARETANKTALQELAQIRVPYQSTADMFVLQKWLFIHNEVPGAETEAFRNSYYQWLDVWFPVWMAAARTTAFRNTPALKIPFWIFQGRSDNQTPATVALEYYQALKAPQKHWVWFEQSGHTIFNTEPQKVAQLLIDSVARF